MARKANPTVIGAFAVGAVLLGVAGIVLLGSGRLFAKTNRYVLYFDSSLKGLSVGSPVTFRGIKIGSVTDIRVVADLDDLEFQIPVIIEIDLGSFTDAKTGLALERRLAADVHEATSTLIEKGLRAHLQVRSIVTGMLEVALEFRPDMDVTLVGGGADYPEIPTVPSSMQKLSRTIQELPIDELTQSVLEAVRAVERLAASEDLQTALASASGAVKQVEELMRQVNARFNGLAEKVEQGIDEIRELARNVDSEVKPLSTSLAGTSDEARRLLLLINEQVEPVLSRLSRAMEAAQGAIAQAENTLQSAEGMTSQAPALLQELSAAVREVRQAARSLHVLTEQLQQHPESLIRGKGGE